MSELITSRKNLIFYAILFAFIAFGGFFASDAQAQLACSEYGPMAYEDYSGYCKCMSGYVFQDDYIGTRCVSADSICKDDYGVMSRYDSLSNSCECSYGYVLGKDSIGRTQCISDDKACQNQLGLHSRATYGGQCECSYGYVIDTNMFGDKQCTDGDQVCRADHGYNSSYNSLSNKCECDDDYTFDDDYQCVEKQHNVYFKLLDINPENDKELLIKSDYDSRKYIVRVGVGCLSISISRYEGKNLVVNLGTDYEVDMFDTVVLQDHDQTCSIMHRERTYDDSFPEPEEEEIYYYTPPVNTYTPLSQNTTPEPPIVTPEPTPVESQPVVVEDQPVVEESLVANEEEATDPVASNQPGEIESTTTTSSEITESTDTKPEAIRDDNEEPNFFVRIINFLKGLF